MSPTVNAVPTASTIASVVGDSTTTIALPAQSVGPPVQPDGCRANISRSGGPISTNAAVANTISRSGRGASRPVGKASTSAAKG